MGLKKIKGNTYFIKGGTNTGIVVLDNKNVLLIDPGLGGMRPQKILNSLKDMDLSIKYIINTHEHSDHYEGCSKLKELDNNIEILSSKEAKAFIDYPNKFADYALGGKHNKFFNFKVLKQKSNLVKVDKVIEEGNIVLNNKKIEIIKLKGHSEGSIGVLTEDKVFFVGDLFIGNSIINKFDLLLIYDVKEYLDSISKVKDIDFEYMVLGHGKEIYSKEESYEIIKSHYNAIKKYINQVKELLELPITMENILKNIINNNNLTCNYTEYYFFRSSIMSIISYLIDLGQVDYSINLGEMLYYSKKA